MTKKKFPELSKYEHLMKGLGMDVRLNNVRIAFPEVFEAKAFKAGDTPRYSATFLIPKGSDNERKVWDAIEEKAEEKWGAKAATIVKRAKADTKLCCFTDGDLKDYDGFQGCMALAANNKSKPLLVDRDKTALDSYDRRLDGGHYVNALISFWMQDNAYGKALRCELKGVQVYKEGEPFSGSSPADLDDFDDLGFDEEDVDLA